MEVIAVAWREELAKPEANSGPAHRRADVEFGTTGFHATSLGAGAHTPIAHPVGHWRGLRMSQGHLRVEQTSPVGRDSRWRWLISPVV